MKVSAKLNGLRIAPRKSKLVADLIKGMDVAEALDQLDIHVKRTSPYMKKLLLSAIANGENNFGIDKDNMYVYNVIIGAGPTMKRWMPKAFGRAGEILKRTTKIEIILEERVEGKNRKTKEQIDNEKRKKLEEKRKMEKELFKEEEKKSVSEKKEKLKLEDGSKKETKKQGWAKKIFQRKSM
jgi:large subunit ribosomal protein L22